MLDLGANFRFLPDRPAGVAAAAALEAGLRPRGWGAVALSREAGGGLLTVPARSRAEAFSLLVDSGATSTFLDLRMARRLGLSLRATRAALSGIHGRWTVLSTARLPSLVIGGIALGERVVGVADLSAWSPDGTVSRPNFSGLLGGDWLSEGRAVLDLEHLTLYWQALQRR